MPQVYLSDDELIDIIIDRPEIISILIQRLQEQIEKTTATNVKLFNNLRRKSQ